MGYGSSTRDWQADRAEESSKCLPAAAQATATRPQGARKLRDANPTHFSAHQPCLHACCLSFSSCISFFFAPPPP